MKWNDAAKVEELSEADGADISTSGVLVGSKTLRKLSAEYIGVSF